MQRLFVLVSLWLCICTAAGVAHADEKVLVMAYPLRDKLPMIADAPSDEGIFKDLFSAAAARMGMTLQIKRLPKKRIFVQMAAGEVDFYPASSFANDRVPFMYWFENGLRTREVCITRLDVPTITNLDRAPPMRLGMEMGGSKADFGKLYPQFTVVELGSIIDFDVMATLLTMNRADMYFLDVEVVDYYKGKKPLAERGLKEHPDCLQPLGPSYVGFARKSAKFSEVANPGFKPRRPVSPTNQATLMKDDSLAARLARVLAEMNASGETRRIFDKGMARRF